jgi:hypothetical protein
MEELDLEFAQAPKSRTAFVVVLLALAAFTFSYLGAFCVPEALASQNIITRWQPGHDPRPHWMAISFVALTVLFCGSGLTARIMSWRQLRRIDSMADE